MRRKAFSHKLDNHAVPITDHQRWGEGRKSGREMNQKSEIRKLQNSGEAEKCARMMTESEPWRLLCQTYDVSLKTVIDPSREIYLALMNGEVIGFVILHMRGVLPGYIQAVCVAPEWRNKGMGSQLMVFAEERIFRETSSAFICASPFSEDALRLYERLGYEVTMKSSVDSEILLRKRRDSTKELEEGTMPSPPLNGSAP